MSIAEGLGGVGQRLSRTSTEAPMSERTEERAAEIEAVLTSRGCRPEQHAGGQDAGGKQHDEWMARRRRPILRPVLRPPDSTARETSVWHGSITGDRLTRSIDDRATERQSNERRVPVVETKRATGERERGKMI